MPEPIIYIDRSRILPGKLEELKIRIAELVDFIDEREPQLLFYGFYLDEESGRMTVVVVHPDAASVELHMDVGAAAFRRFADLIEMEGIEVYGEASDRMLEQLKHKAHDLGEDGSVRVDQLQAGFSRVVESAVRCTTDATARADVACHRGTHPWANGAGLIGPRCSTVSSGAASVTDWSCSGPQVSPARSADPPERWRLDVRTA